MADQHPGLSREERENVKELAAPRAPVIYEVVRRQGEEELSRPVGSLLWSGIAGGITIMASVIAEGAIAMKLPHSIPWRGPAMDLGYSLGFVMVILGRMQLFTEQTVVAVLPIVADPSWRKLAVMVRLWAVVFIGNMIGTALAAALNGPGQVVGQALGASMLAVAARLIPETPLHLLLTGIPAGFLIASVSWILAGVVDGHFWIVLALTTTIALGNFTHVIAGSAEAFLLLFAGKITAAHALAGIILPALGGNIIGGTLLFALLAHAQVRREL
jgi:formate/nitrite transporter FocA (FNT family)